MAMATAIKRRDFSSVKRVIVEHTFSGTYTANGEAVTLWKDLELKTVLHVSFTPGQTAAPGATAVHPEFDKTNNKVKLYRTDAIDDFGEELPGATSLTGVGPISAEYVGY